MRLLSFSLSLQRLCRLGVLACAGALAVAGCSAVDGTNNRVVNAFTPYKPDVVQGNFVSKEQVAALKPGMSRMQVRMILGTPLLTSLFHDGRWEYYFSIQRQGVPAQSYKLTVFFKGDELERFEGDEMPTEAEFVARIGTRYTPGKAPSLQASEEALKKYAPAAPAAGAAADAASAVPTGNYPPLESSPH